MRHFDRKRRQRPTTAPCLSIILEGETRCVHFEDEAKVPELWKEMESSWSHLEFRRPRQNSLRRSHLGPMLRLHKVASYALVDATSCARGREKFNNTPPRRLGGAKKKSFQTEILRDLFRVLHGSARADLILPHRLAMAGCGIFDGDGQHNISP